MLEKLKDIALPHIAIILSYQTLPLIPSENSDVKSLTERKYADLKKDLEGDLGGSEGSICNILKPPTPQEEVVIVGISQLQTIGRHIV